MERSGSIIQSQVLWLCWTYDMTVSGNGAKSPTQM